MKEDWDEIGIDCICEYKGIRKGNCKNSYTDKCENCLHNELLTGKTENYYEVDLI